MVVVLDTIDVTYLVLTGKLLRYLWNSTEVDAMEQATHIHLPMQYIDTRLLMIASFPKVALMCTCFSS